jgi:tetratricopeptide (TPR) repeat protein
LGGDFAAAAELYARQGEFMKASALYQHGGLVEAAANLHLNHLNFTQALQLYIRLEDPLGQARAYEGLGDRLNAARMYRKGVELLRAGELFEAVGDIQEALQCFAQLGDFARMEQILLKAPLQAWVVEFWEKLGRWEKAAALAHRLGLLQKSAEDYRKADLAQEELHVLLEAAAMGNAAWADRRIVELARALGRFVEQGEAHLRLGESEQAARAYYYAACQAENRLVEGGDEDARHAVADLYEQAAELFRCEGLEGECQECRWKVIELRRQPLIIVEGRAAQAFREGDINQLDLVVRNVGKGVAHQVRLEPRGGRFEVAREAIEEVEHLYPGREKPLRIFLRPLKDQVGVTVPLELEWRWEDRLGRDFKDHSITTVSVRRLDEPHTATQPIILQGGTLVQGTYISGDQVSGDKIGGDRVEAGAQKGDRVEIRRQATQVRPAAPGKAQRLCPNCSVPLPPKARYCDACGQALGKAEKDVG